MRTKELNQTLTKTYFLREYLRVATLEHSLQIVVTSLHSGNVHLATNALFAILAMLRLQLVVLVHDLLESIERIRNL